MAIFAYASPILPGRTPLVRERYKQKIAEESLPQVDAERIRFWGLLGLKGWSCFLQRLRERDYFIHCLEGDSLESIIGNLRELIEQGHPFAIGLHDFYREALGKDYLDPDSMPCMEQIFNLELPQEGDHRLPCHKRAFIYPLLSNQREEQKRYSAQAKEGGGAKEFFASYRVRRMAKWIQTLGHMEVIVYYQEMELPSHQVALRHLALREAPWYKRATDELIAQTGLTFEELTPHLEQLSFSDAD